MKIREVIDFSGVGDSIRINGITDMLSPKWKSDYIVPEALVNGLSEAIVHISSPDAFAVCISGGRGTGKTHTMLYLLALLTQGDNIDEKLDERIRKACSRASGEYECVLMDLHDETAPLRQVVLNRLQAMIGTDLFASFGEFSQTDDGANLEYAAASFSFDRPEKMCMLVMDGFSEFIERKKEAEVKEDMVFLKALGNAVKTTCLRLILNIDTRVLKTHRMLSVSKCIYSRLANFMEVPIRSEAISQILCGCCLKKTTSQYEAVRKHLEKFYRFYPAMRDNADKYIKMYPLHPDAVAMFDYSQLPSDCCQLSLLANAIEKSMNEAMAPAALYMISLDHIWAQCVDKCLADKVSPEMRRAMAREAAIEKKVQHLPLGSHEKEMTHRAVAGLVYRDMMLRDEEAVIGMSAAELKDALCLWIEDAKNELSLIEQIDSVLTEVAAACTDLIEQEERSGRFFLPVKKQTSYSEKITLEQISAKINVSRTTLYKVINNKGHVSEKTRAVVLDALKKYHYMPNLNARDLAHHKTYQIGYIGMAHHGSAFFAGLVQKGIESALSEMADHGLQVFSAVSRVTDPLNQILNIESMLSMGIRDFVIVPCQPKVLAEEIKKLRQMDCNIVYLSRYAEETDRTFVGIDYIKSGKLAAEMMTKILPGGGNIAITTSSKLSEDLWVKQRHDGFVSFIQNKKGYKLLTLRDTITGEAEAERVCQSLVEEYPELDAIYDISYKSDVVARKLIQLGKDQDIKLIGFDVYEAVVPYVKSSAIDIIIGQSIPKQAHDAVKMLFEHKCYGMPLEQKNYYLGLDVVVSMNIDCFDY